MDPFTHGDTIPLIFYVVYEFYYDISEPNDIFYGVSSNWKEDSLFNS